MNKAERIEKLACKLCDLGNRDRPEECDIHRKPTDDVCSWIFDAKELLSFLESTLGCAWLSDDQTPPEIKRRMALTTQRMIARYYLEANFRKVEIEREASK